MSANADAILEQIKKLTPAEFSELMVAIRQIVGTHQREALERLRGCGKGEGLLEALLEDRRKERARG